MSDHHHHHHHHDDHDHDHGHDDSELGQAYSLYTKIDTYNVECLNEVEDGSGKNVFKPWDDRLDTSKYVESDADEELLLRIPFTGDIKLKGFVIIGGEGETHPAQVKLYKNRPGMTFDDTTASADQEFQLQEDRDGSIEYPTMVSRFSGVTHLTMYFASNFGAEATRIYYIGLSGEFAPTRRHEVTICNYEAQANPADHRIKGVDSVRQQIS